MRRPHVEYRVMSTDLDEAANIVQLEEHAVAHVYPI